MNYYEHNIESLIQYRKNIYDKMNDINLPSSDHRLEQIFDETAINGEQILILQKNGTQFRLNSSYHPTHEAKIWSEQFSLSNLNNIITMFGLGNGVFAKEIAVRLDKEDFLFIYEPCRDVFAHVLQYYDLTDLLSNRNVILIIEGINDFDFHNLLQNALNIANMFSQTQCAHPYYTELFGESCVTYWKELRDTMVHTKININTEILFGERLIINSFKNIKYIKNSNIIDDFVDDILKDVPAIVVAAGPSLKANLEELKRAKGKAYIFVVDRVLDYVLDNGLEPDFVVTIDPIKPVEFFTQREDVTIPLLSELVSNWEVLDRHKGKKIYYSCSSYLQKMYEYSGKKYPRLTTGASVATAAFSICAKLGFNKIVLVGQDLAYDGDFTHAGGVKEKFENDSDDIMVEGIDGNPVRSRYDWFEFLTWFKDVIILNPQITVIDTKEKGAKIQGTVLMPLKQVIDTYGVNDLNIEQVIRDKESTFNEEEFRKVKKFFEESYDDLRTMKRKAREALELCERQIKEYNKNQEDTDITIKNYKKISKINKYINEQPTYSLLDSFITSMTASYISKLYRFSEDVKTDKIETYKKSKKIYQAVIDGVDFALPILTEEIEQLVNE